MPLRPPAPSALRCSTASPPGGASPAGGGLPLSGEGGALLRVHRLAAQHLNIFIRQLYIGNKTEIPL